MTARVRSFVRFWSLCLLVISLIVSASDAQGQSPKTKGPRHGPAAHSRTPMAGQVTPARVSGYMPKHLKGMGVAQATFESDGTEVVDGATYYEDPGTGELVLAEDPLGGTSCPDGTCGQCDSCELVPCCVIPTGNLEVFGGVQGFTGPTNRGGSASFGFSEGLNYGIRVPGFNCLGAQVGFRVTHSNFSGAEFTNGTRTQTFLTAGLFRRVDVGLQGGLVVDYLSETWYRDADFLNLRGELSWMVDGYHDFGFWFSAGTRTSLEPSPENVELLENWQTTDLFAFFYRRQFGACRDGEARIFAGFTGQSDGLIGADVRLPLSPAWALETGFAYLVPKQGNGTIANYPTTTQGIASVGHAQESWNVGINLVWYPGRVWGGGDDYYYRPLFRVADNASLMIDLP